MTVDLSIPPRMPSLSMNYYRVLSKQEIPTDGRNLRHNPVTSPRRSVKKKKSPTRVRRLITVSVEISKAQCGLLLSTTESILKYFREAERSFLRFPKCKIEWEERRNLKERVNMRM